MKKPNNWENTQVYGEFEALELGGHICKIMKVEETKSKNGKDMILIYLDIAEGEQKGYFSDLYKSDNRDNKKWKGIVYQLVEDNEGNTNRGLKTFINAVEKSNKGFKQDTVWNENFATYFKDKLIGGVFGREQYDDGGKLKWSTKCVSFRDMDAIKKGVPVPEDKYLDGVKNTTNNALSGFSVVENDDDLPF